MKQKIVIKISMNDDKSRSKALKTAVGVSGIEAVALTGDGKDKLQVLGDGIDSVQLIQRLRKNVAYAELESVGENKKEDPPKKAAEAPTPQIPVFGWYAPPSYNVMPSYQYVGVRDPDTSCIIM